MKRSHGGAGIALGDEAFREPLHGSESRCPGRHRIRADQKMRFIINIVTTRNNTVMTPPARMKSGTR